MITGSSIGNAVIQYVKGTTGDSIFDSIRSYYYEQGSSVVYPVSNAANVAWVNCKVTGRDSIIEEVEECDLYEYTTEEENDLSEDVEFGW